MECGQVWRLIEVHSSVTTKTSLPSSPLPFPLTLPSPPLPSHPPSSPLPSPPLSLSLPPLPSHPPSLQSFSPGHSQPLTSIYHNLAMFVTSSKDGSVHIHSSGTHPRRMATITHHTSAVTEVSLGYIPRQHNYPGTSHLMQVAFSRSTLALASSDRGISLWSPSSH